MKRSIATTLLMCLFMLKGFAQEDTLRIVRDSLRMQKDLQGSPLLSPLDVSAERSMDIPFPSTSPTDSSIHIPLQRAMPTVPYYTNPSPMFKGDYSTGGVLLSHRHGALVGSGSQTTLPDIGRSNDASLTYIHSFAPRWTVSVGVDANKMHMNHFTGQSFGASGSRLIRRLTAWRSVPSADTTRAMCLGCRVFATEERWLGI